MKIYSDFIQLPITEIIYDHQTGLFPYSPRKKIDQNLVTHLKESMLETGVWSPILVRSNTMEGIAGNHRFLAILTYAQEMEENLNQFLLPVFSLDVDEGEAKMIALIENDVREDISLLEKAKTIVSVGRLEPQALDHLFNIDKPTIEHLSYWPEEVEVEINDPQRKKNSFLNSDWVKCIESSLSSHPELKMEFLDHLHKPIYIRDHTLEDMQREINQRLIENGRKFEPGKTWNSEPARKCLGNIDFDTLENNLRSKPQLERNLYASNSFLCPHLKVKVNKITQFIPDQKGIERIQCPVDPNNYPPETIKNGYVAGYYDDITQSIDYYCTAPDSDKFKGCFGRLETERKQLSVKTFIQKGHVNVIPYNFHFDCKYNALAWTKSFQKTDSCTPETCLHTHDNPSGYGLMIKPGDVVEMLCLNPTCAKNLQQVRLDEFKEQKKIEAILCQVSLNQLDTMIFRKVMEGNEDQLTLSSQIVMDILEKVLLPSWDKKTMLNVVIGWQESTRIQVEGELNKKGLVDNQILNDELEARYPNLWLVPSDDNIIELFKNLRKEIVNHQRQQEKWTVLLILLQSLREHMGNREEIENGRNWVETL